MEPQPGAILTLVGLLCSSHNRDMNNEVWELLDSLCTAGAAQADAELSIKLA